MTSIVFHRPVTEDEDGYIEQRERNVCVRVGDEVVSMDIYGEWLDDNGDPESFHTWFVMNKDEARQLRDFLNANVKGD